MNAKTPDGLKGYRVSMVASAAPRRAWSSVFGRRVKANVVNDVYTGANRTSTPSTVRAGAM